MSAHIERRFLRPRYVFFASGYMWVIDERQPVAALFDPHTEQLEHLASWSDLPPASAGARRSEIAADDTGIWVQNQQDGPLVHVGVHGIDHAEYTEGHTLICAGRGGAWCATITRRRTDIAPSPDIPPRRTPVPPALLVACPDGGTCHVEVDAAAIVSVDFDESSLYVGIEHDPWIRVPTDGEGRGKRPGFEVQYSSSVLQVPLHGPVPRRIGRDTHPCAEDRKVDYTNEYADVSYNETHRRKRAVDSSLRWYWGKDPNIEEITVVRAYGNEESAPVTALELAGTHVAHGAAGFERLWLVVRLDAVSEKVRSVLTTGVGGDIHSVSIDGIDITDRCWPVGPEPLDHHSYVRYCLRGLDRTRFSDEVDDVVATYPGQWRSGQIHLRFRHLDYPGLILETRLNLYDEQGVRLANFLAHVLPELMEQAGTRAYPPASEAVGGVLYC